MKIYSMTATFGKLDGQTLNLQPGLNVIHAPNEWGKSTWCAFLCAMLYGIDTRQRTSKDILADKERYSPWSGKPMSGRIDLCWNGQDITIERDTKGRVVFGNFRAYETATGIPVTQLTAENCGQVLLGVEKNVFTRTGFIRLTDLPVTEDDALRRRLNALVTTGDESGASDALAKKLRELKNACRHNKTGALPQAQEQREQLQSRLTRLQQLHAQDKELAQQQAQLEQQADQLKNHLAALAYADAQEHRQQLRQSENARDTAREQLVRMEAQCRDLPATEEARDQLQALQSLRQELELLQTRELKLPLQPEPPQQRAPFYGMDAEQTQQMLQRDLAKYRILKDKKKYLPLGILALAGTLAWLAMLLALPMLRPAFLKWLPLLALLPLVIKLFAHAGDGKAAAALEETYGSKEPAQWEAAAQRHLDARNQYQQELQAYRQERETLARSKAALLESRQSLTGGQELSHTISRLEQALRQQQEREALRAQCARLEETVKTLQAVPLNAQAPAFPDALTLSRELTQERLRQTESQHRQLQLRLGQVQGQAEALGSEEALIRELSVLDQRIQKLEDTYQALIIAQQTLTEAANALQRQFAPRLTSLARDFFRQLTTGRYDRLVLGEDLSLLTAAEEENSLLPSRWRSDGTVDQLYLSLRLAAARELTPDAPLVLDDALVRFDEDRLGKAMDLLLTEAASRQVLVFTCQTREQQYLDSL